MIFQLLLNKMQLIYRMESVLIAIICILCSIVIFQLLYKLRSTLPWRVNCWFCNNYLWVKFVIRNSWTCPKCDQYNGFTKDGDYNKPLFPHDHVLNTPKVFQKSPPKNGLCKMCNINQQLKVIQLANFIPMNEKNFENEIELFRIQLEKAYKLCSPCKKVLQTKLHKEKETLLGFKLLETRTPEKKNLNLETQNQKLKSFINNTSMFIAGVLLLLVSVECYKNVMKHKNLSSTMNNMKKIFSGLLESIITIIKLKTSMTFPSLENYLNNVHVLYLDLDILPKQFRYNESLDNLNLLTQKALGGFVSLIQIIGHLWNINKMKHTIIIDLLWTVFVITSIAHNSVAMDPTIMTLFKLSSTLAVMLVYKSMKTRTVEDVLQSTPKRMKSHSNRTVHSLIDDDTMIFDTDDDDVSLSKFSLHNFSECSNENASPPNNTLLNGRSFTPRSQDVWTKPKLNPTFTVNSVHTKSPSSVSDTVFLKPSFNKYQNLTKNDSDSDLDQSISSLSISSPKKASTKSDSIFALRKFTATPQFVAPTPLTRSRPLISPSKLGHSTSWVAGGYWGLEGDRHIFSMNGSRSSSQSSGFESQASGMTQRNIFSQPPSREESVCDDPDRPSILLDRFQNCNMSNYGNFHTQNFAHVTSPVFPQMQYNGHVQIPQPRFAHANATPNAFIQQQYVKNSMFKTPGGPGLIKLPQVNSFVSQ